MGAYGLAVDDCDIYWDVRAEINQRYRNGYTWKTIYKDYVYENEPDFDTPEEFSYWFAVADILWEYKALNKKLFGVVKKMVDSKLDLELWDTDPKDAIERDKELQEFLKKIATKKKGKIGFEEEFIEEKEEVPYIETLTVEQIESSKKVWENYTFKDLSPNENSGFFSKWFKK